MLMRMKDRLRVALCVILAGVSAGLVGAAMSWGIHVVEAHLSVWLSLVLGIGAGVLWWQVRRRKDSSASQLFDALAQTIAVGAGASLGREQAPRQVAALVARKLWMPPTQRETLAAAAAGAGLAAVYNIPLAGVLYTLEVMPIRRTKRLCVFAIACCGIATLTAWPLLGGGAFYSIPEPQIDQRTILLIAPVIALGMGLGWVFRQGAVRQVSARVQGPWLILSVPVAIAAVLLVAQGLPEVPGNGQLLLDFTFHSPLQWQHGAALVAAKLLLTWLCLRAGAAGGVLTPSLAVGGTAGGVLGTLCGADPLTLALVGAASSLATTQRAPLFAAVMTIELTHPSALVSCLMLAIAIPISLLHARRQSGPTHR
ncbi:chloride channel protein [Corynebacterium pseudopelargi]|uniref:Putative voltage-gated ClC-type chloride channel ClcB n=1 Tax=Corynebacterium pseudopelargi TaxID=2080757 RepID=A0A3G6IVG1_9CORY|nr:chloride channel protein [Corynebacterium pseudopelargi]AZA09573.1 putative voltage-gated ClC-type chloride channel ClcB [Corynebacterium pseudopelargi]